MEQFNLDTWLQDKSRKVMTRRGNPVRIICADRKHGEDDLPIVFLEECSNGEEFLLTCKSNGTPDYPSATQFDLFFADEENQLTEFDKVLKEVIEDVQNGDYIEEESFDFWKSRLLDLAKNELLKDLPKWKRNNCFFNTGNKFEFGKTSLRRFDGYEIPYSELEKLPKEE